MLRDISDRKRTEEDFTNSNQELELRVRERNAEVEQANRILEEQIKNAKQAEANLIAWKDRYEAAIRASERIIYDWDLATDERIYGNIEHILGYSDEEMAGGKVRWLELIHPNDRDAFLRAVNRTLDSGEPMQLEYQIRRKDGTYIPVKSDGHVVGDNAGERIRIVGFVQDLTERNQVQQERRKDQHLLTAILNNIHVGIVACDDVGVLTFFNPAAREFHGLPERPIPAEEWTDVYDLYLADGKTPMSKEQIPLFRALNGERVNDVEMIIAPRSGQARTLLASGQALLGPAGQIAGAVIAMHDITERRLAENACQHSEARLADAQRMAHLGNWEWDIQTGHIVWSDETYRIFGFNLHEVTVTFETFLATIHPDDKDFVRNAITTTLEQRTPFELEFRIKRPNGEDRFISAQGELVCDDAGVPSRMIGTALDVTDRKRIEDELRLARLRADAGNRAKSEFLAKMSHEIRTPMNGILGLTDLLLGEELPSEHRDYLNMVQSSAESLLHIIDDVLDISKIDAGKLDLEPTTFNVRACVNSTIQLLRLRADEKKLDVSCSIAPDVPEAIVGDQGRIRQVLGNLVDNAIKFTERGAITVRVHAVSDPSSPKMLEFSVSDTGIGIPPERQQTIFEAFVQADNSTTRRFDGTGLGLAICFQLVELMGGQIRLESVVNEGSTFRFTLPVGPLREQQEPGGHAA